MSDESRELPLFPLNTTLFPGGTLPLHIFEPRYRAMTRRCLEGDERFGVVLIAEGPEVGGRAVPHLVGTVARIALAETLEGGRYNLMTTGERRFAIKRTWLDPAGYLVGWSCRGRRRSTPIRRACRRWSTPCAPRCTTTSAASPTSRDRYGTS